MKKLEEKIKNMVFKEEGNIIEKFDLTSNNIKIEEIDTKKIEKIYFDLVNCCILINLNIEENYLEIHKINIKNIKEILDSKINNFVIDKTQNKFILDEEISRILSNSEYSIYSEKLKYLFLKYFKINKLQEGYKLYKENNILFKKFIAKYILLVYNKRNIPFVKISKIYDDTKIFRLPNTRSYKLKDNCVDMQYKNLSCFLDYNNINEEELLLNKDSVTSFYSYEIDDINKEIYFINPTKKYVETWWDYDCPVLYKHYFNKLYGWEYNILVENSLLEIYVDDKVTELEIQKFCKNYEHTSIYKSMLNTFNTNKLTKEEKKLICEEIDQYTKKIQDILDIEENKIFILKHTILSLNNKMVLKDLEDYTENQLKMILDEYDKNMGLDCGYLYIKTDNKNINNLIMQAAEFNSSYNKNRSLSLKYSWNGQSTTIKDILGKYMQELLKKYDINISYWTVLD